MAYNEKLAARVREALADFSDLEEKIMFRGITFMVNGKMCVSVGSDRIMCRIDPNLHDKALERAGTREMIHSGKVMRGFVFVDQEVLESKKEFDYWLALARDFNSRAKATRKK